MAITLDASRHAAAQEQGPDEYASSRSPISISGCDAAAFKPEWAPDAASLQAGASASSLAELVQLLRRNDAAAAAGGGTYGGWQVVDLQGRTLGPGGGGDVAARAPSMRLVLRNGSLQLPPGGTLRLQGSGAVLLQDLTISRRSHFLAAPAEARTARPLLVLDGGGAGLRAWAHRVAVDARNDSAWSLESAPGQAAVVLSNRTAATLSCTRVRSGGATFGLQVRDAGSQLAAFRSTFTGGHEAAVDVRRGAAAELRNCSLAPAADGSGAADGVRVTAARAPGLGVRLEACTVRGAGTAVNATQQAAGAATSEVAVLDCALHQLAEGGAASDGRLTVAGTDIRGNNETAVFGVAAFGAAGYASVADSRVSGMGTAALLAVERGRVAARRSVIARNAGVGALAGGAGSAVEVEDSRLEFNARAAVQVVSSAQAVLANSTVRCGPGAAGLAAFQASRLLVERSEVLGCEGAVSVSEAEARVADCSIAASTGAAALLATGTGASLLLGRTRVANSSRVGAGVSGGATATLRSGCEVSGSGGVGLLLEGPGSAVLADRTVFSANGLQGLAAFDRATVTCTGCEFSANALAGARVASQASLRCEGCAARGNARGGVEAVAGGNATLAACALAGNDAFGAAAGRDAALQMTGCAVTGSRQPASAGVLVTGGRASLKYCNSTQHREGAAISVLRGGAAALSECRVGGSINGLVVAGAESFAQAHNSVFAGNQDAGAAAVQASHPLRLAAPRQRSGSDAGLLAARPARCMHALRCVAVDSLGWARASALQGSRLELDACELRSNNAGLVVGSVQELQDQQRGAARAARARAHGCGFSDHDSTGVLVLGTAELQDCTLARNTVAGASARFAGAALHAEGCRFVANGGSGAASTAAVLTLRDCDLRGNGATGLVGTQNATLSLQGCVVSGSRRSGIGVAGGSRITVADTLASNNTMYGMLAQQAGTVLQAQNSSADGNGRAGVFVADAADVTLSGVNASGNGGGGLAAEAGGQLAAMQCVVDGNTGAGASVQGVRARLRARSSELSGTAGGPGLAVGGGAAAALEACKLVGNDGDGARVAAAALTASDTSIAGNGGSGVAGSQGAELRLTACSLEGNAQFGVEAEGGGTQLLLEATSGAEGGARGSLRLSAGASANVSTTALRDCGDGPEPQDAFLAAAEQPLVLGSAQSCDSVSMPLSSDGSGGDAAVVAGIAAAAVVAAVLAGLLLWRAAARRASSKEFLPLGAGARELQRPDRMAPSHLQEDAQLAEGQHSLDQDLRKALTSPVCEGGGLDAAVPAAALDAVLAYAAADRGDADAKQYLSVASTAAAAAAAPTPAGQKAGPVVSECAEDAEPRLDTFAKVLAKLLPVKPGVALDVDPVNDISYNAILGRGGFGTVYRGCWSGVGHGGSKTVAVKLLSCDDNKQRQLFKAELDIMARLDHPNIVECYGGCMRPQACCLLLEYVEGGTLTEYIHSARRDRPLSEREVLTIGMQLSLALAYLHPRVVHADIKPDNVLITADGRCKLADFGLSRLKLETALSHQAGGTLSYVSPEAMAGGRVTEATDIYALAMLLWEALAGQRPWQEMVPLQVVDEVLIRRRRPQLPARCSHSLRALIGRMWDHDPRKRPAALQLFKELQLAAVRADHAAAV